MSTLAIFTVAVMTAGQPAMPQAYHDVAAAYRIPPAVLYCLCLQESGLRVSDGSVIPWPWTLNIDGQGLRFDSEPKAWAALKEAIDHDKSVDVGLAQINQHWHGQRFAHPRDMLDPWKNLAAAAAILREQARDSVTWFDAVGRYHAPSHENRARDYANNAYERCLNWRERARARA